MTAARGAAGVALFCAACLAGAGALAGAPPAKGGEAPLKMEELEVRGILEKPGTLYLPLPAEVPLPLPVRFDFFRDDVARPILPSEIIGDRLPNGGARESGNASD